MALAAAEARATAAEEELEVLRDALAASAPSNASNDNALITALERERKVLARKQSAVEKLQQQVQAEREETRRTGCRIYICHSHHTMAVAEEDLTCVHFAHSVNSWLILLINTKGRLKC